MKATDDLRHDHDLILRALSVLDALAAQANEGRPAPAAETLELLSFFQRYADGFHHLKEEDLLFPALTARGFPQRGGPIAVMLHEHEEGRRLLRALLDAAPEIATSSDARERFVDAARSYVALLADHIGKENDVLFHMADRALDPDTDRRLQEGFERSRATLGASEYDRYHALVASMAERAVAA
jgi:hemerythrin-like domain-containing protein